MGTKAIRFTESELAALVQVLEAATEAGTGQDGEMLNTLWLKVTGRKPAPKAKAHKSSTPAVSEADVAALRKRLDACTSRDEAREVLTVRRVPLLRALGKSVGLGSCGRYAKDDLVSTLIHFIVGFRLDHNAVLNAKFF